MKFMSRRWITEIDIRPGVRFCAFSDFGSSLHRLITIEHAKLNAYHNATIVLLGFGIGLEWGLENDE